jgi:hypothetical protein
MVVDKPTLDAEGESGTTSGGTNGLKPAYMSFQTLISVLDTMAEKGAPNLVDRHFFGNWSGSVIATTIASFRFLGLIDDEKRPVQPTLDDLLPQDTRKERLRKIIEEKYPDAVRLGQERASQAQLDKIFSGYGLSGETVRKASAFYLAAAQFTDIPVSPYFASARPGGNGGGSRRAGGAAKKSAPKKAGPRPDEATVPSQRTTRLDLDEKKAAYIDLLLKLAEDDGKPNLAILDRLHAVLGYGDAPATAETTPDQ